MNLCPERKKNTLEKFNFIPTINWKILSRIRESKDKNKSYIYLEEELGRKEGKNPYIRNKK